MKGEIYFKNPKKVVMKKFPICHRCGITYQNTGWEIRIPPTCNTCHDVVFGNLEREQQINKRIELLSLIHKATTLMTNEELEDILLYMKNLCLSLISSPLKDFKKG